MILFTLLLIGFDALFGRRHNGILFVAPLALLLAAIGHQKSLYLGDPLYPTDFLYSRQIMELAPLLVKERPLTAVIIAVGGAAALFLLVTSWRYWRRRFPAIRWRMRMARLAVVLPALAFFVSIMDFATFSWTRDRLQIIPIMWDQKENYASNGFAIAFALNVPMAKVKAPPSYEDDVLDAIGPALTGVSMPEEKPDIIVVMSESFWDPTLLPRHDDHARSDADRARHALRLDVLAGIRRHDRQCRVRGADRLFQRLPALRQHPLSAICARSRCRRWPTSSAREGYETTRDPSVRGLVLEPRACLSMHSASTASSRIEKLPPMAWRGPLVSDEALTDEIIKRADADRTAFLHLRRVSLQGHGPYEPNRYHDACRAGGFGRQLLDAPVDPLLCGRRSPTPTAA